MRIDQIDLERHPDGIHRDQWKRPIMQSPDAPTQTTKCMLCGIQVPGVAHMRMTSFIDVLENKEGVAKWEIRCVAKGLALRGDLVLDIASHMSKDPTQEDDDKSIGKICESAAEIGGKSEKSRKGTAYHRIIERIDKGESPVIPDGAKVDIDAYYALAQQEHFTVEESEINVVIDGVRFTHVKNPLPGIGGRFDMVIATSYPCQKCGRFRRIADLKTGRVDYGRNKMAMQLAGYSLAKRYHADTGQRSDLEVCQCWGIIIHLPVGQGKAQALWANLTAAQPRLGLAYQVWQARAQEDLLQEDAPIDIAGLITMAGDRQSVANLYEQFCGTGQWTEQHTQLAQTHLAQLEAPK